ncbi:hypothetical protein D3C80_2181220 [compost metagenome]
MGITDLPFQGFVDTVRKSNLQTVDQLGKEAEKAKAEAEKATENHEGEGGKQAAADKGAEQGAGHAGGHSGNGH